MDMSKLTSSKWTTKCIGRYYGYLHLLYLVTDFQAKFFDSLE